MNVLAVSAIEVEYRGRAAHAAAAPHAGINALDGLVTAYQSIAQLRQHIRPTERIHGIITDGGQAPNIVPERAAGLFFVRAATERRLGRAQAARRRLLSRRRAGERRRVCTCAPVGDDYSDMWTNAPLASAYQANLGTLGRRVVDAPAGAVSGSTDMGNVSKLRAVDPPDDRASRRRASPCTPQEFATLRRRRRRPARRHRRRQGAGDDRHRRAVHAGPARGDARRLRAATQRERRLRLRARSRSAVRGRGPPALPGSSRRRSFSSSPVSMPYFFTR